MADDVVGPPAARLPDVESASASYPSTARDRNPDAVGLEPLETGGFECGGAVEEGAWPGLEDRSPELLLTGERPGRDRHALRTHPAPLSRAHPSADLCPGHPGGVQLAPRDHARLFGGQGFSAFDG